MDRETLTLKQAAERVGVSAGTLKRWAETGVIPHVHRARGEWTPVAVSHARLVARMRERGHRLEHIREASRQGRLAYGYIEDLFPDGESRKTLRRGGQGDGPGAGADRALLDRASACPRRGSTTCPTTTRARSSTCPRCSAPGFPLVAFLQLCRVYGQALAQIADAEVRLFHLYVHEPLMREGVPGLEMAEEMEELARDLLPISSPLMDYIHRRFLQHFVEQDVVGHMEGELEDQDLDLGRVRVAIAFADLAGYTRFTEEEGEEEALSSVERFVEGVTNTLPDGARVVKTIGDEVMVVGQDVAALVDWAVGYTGMFEERPEPRIGIHYGSTLYRDGDYFGREVNLASRVVARARGGEVLVTDSVIEAVDASHLRFEPIGQVKLKGFDEPRQLCRATPRAR